MEIKNFIEERLDKSEKLLKKCNNVLSDYQKMIGEESPKIDMKDAIGQPIYIKRKKTLDDDRELKMSLSKKLEKCNKEELEEIARQLKSHKIKDNEEFVEDFEELLEDIDSKSEMGKISSEIVLELFASYVIDQKNMSEFNVEFYNSILQRLREIESSCESENE